MKPIPGTVIVNVGYLLMRWSNGRWKNTIHRVVEPPTHLREMELNEPDASSNAGADSQASDTMSPARYSIPFSAHPDPGTMVNALPGCWNEGLPKKWGPLNVDKYRRRKMANLYA